jgi:hypothetical protein
VKLGRVKLTGPCLRDAGRWLLSHARSVLAVTAILVAVAGGYAILLHRAVDDRHRREQDQVQRVSEAREGRRYLCDRVNALPTKIARALTLSDQIRQITGPTTTILPSDLTDGERLQVAQLRAELADALADLGHPIDCQVAVTGTTTTTRP